MRQRTRTSRPLRQLIPGVLLAVAGSVGALQAWGREGHRIITAEAARRMPADSRAFFEAAAEALARASLEPDIFKDGDPGERSRHYLNLDLLGEPPYEDLPRDLDEASRRYGVERLAKAGTLPWRLLEVFGDLVDAMRAGEADRITRVAGHMAHYTGDLFQPLHLTSNFDGQKSCNQGVHEAFESEMIERRAGDYREAVARGRRAARPLDDPAGQVISWVIENARLVDEILAADTAALRALKKERKDYFDSMDRMAGPLAERQMSAAAGAIASLWHTAWIRAGRPSLPSVPP